ncbi:hypothetical protein Ccrd_008133 [Cynara cardunculus var. scolymus]|uniref:Prefoldin n=1 Tax=Cynara cardunculus var. scolymus TaxID=59895 RepID=A0A118JTH2_CYNCS|nr:hypothetical protein Ccrd_008133 [Cynara cardunculus var. scolymus]
MAANTDLAPSVPTASPLGLKNENVTPINSKIAELSESRAELLNRIQSLKNDLQSWRSKLDTQVKSYRDPSLCYEKKLLFPEKSLCCVDRKCRVEAISGDGWNVVRMANVSSRMLFWQIVQDCFAARYAAHELSDLKKTLNVEVDQLRSEFKELRTTLQQQQDDLQDVAGDVKDTKSSTIEDETM